MVSFAVSVAMGHAHLHASSQKRIGKKPERPGDVVFGIGNFQSHGCAFPQKCRLDSMPERRHISARMHPVDLVVCLLIVLVVLVTVAGRLKVSQPIVLVIGGLVLALFSRLPEVRLEPDIVFLVFLPPLLYWDALNSSWRDFRENWRPISLLAIGLVFTTTMAVMVAAHFLLGFLWGPHSSLGLC